MVLASFLVASCSGPAEKPASTESSDAKAVTASDTQNSTSAAPAPAEVAESPKPQAPVKKTPVAKADNSSNYAPIAVVNNPAPPPAPAPAPSAPAPVPVAVAPVPPPPPAPTSKDVLLPSGTLFSVRMIDPVDSKTDHVGQTFKASMESPVILDGQTVIPKGESVFVKLTKVETAGKLSGTSELQLQLDRVYLGNKSYTVLSNTYQAVGDSQGKKAVKQTGIGAGIGAVIGAIAGGKKGAAIGAGVGGGAGATATAIENGEQVRVEPEAKLTFRLEQPLNVTVPIGAAAGKPVPVPTGTPTLR